MRLSFLEHKCGLISVAFLIPSVLLGCNLQSSTSQTQRAIEQTENPDLLPIKDNISGLSASYEYRFSHLSLQGEVEMPWTETYWPFNQGLIATRWNVPGGQSAPLSLRRDFKIPSLEEAKAMPKEQLAQLSPAEKYDIYMGNSEFFLTHTVRKLVADYQQWHRESEYSRRITELKKNVVKKEELDSAIKKTKDETANLEIPDFVGICNGWAAASLVFNEPNPIIVKSYNNDSKKFDGTEIPFGASDLKALTSYFIGILNSESGFVGTSASTRCAKNPKGAGFVVLDVTATKKTEKVITDMQAFSECGWLNAATFHIVLSNVLGGKIKKGVVADLSEQADEKWNYPIFKFASTPVLGEDSKPKQFPKSKNAAAEADFEYEMATSIWIRREANPYWFKIPNFSGSVEKKLYRYRLEIDKSSGRIVGGSWISGNPPFSMWIQNAPGFNDNANYSATHRYLLRLHDLLLESFNNPSTVNFTANKK